MSFLSWLVYGKSLRDDEYATRADARQGPRPQARRMNSSKVRQRPTPCTYWPEKPSFSTAEPVESFTRPPMPPPTSPRLDEPWTRAALSTMNDGIIEKSVVPSMGEEMRMPFQVTCVCDEEVPLKFTVDRVARP